MAVEQFSLLGQQLMDQDITNVCEVITPILMSFCFNIVDSKHNLYCIIVTEATYNKHYNMQFIIPKDLSWNNKTIDTNTGRAVVYNASSQDDLMYFAC